MVEKSATVQINPLALAVTAHAQLGGSAAAMSAQQGTPDSISTEPSTFENKLNNKYRTAYGISEQETTQNLNCF